MLSLAGPVPADSSGYIERAYDDLVMRAVMRQEYVNLRGGRQSGKTSSLLRLRPKLSAAGARSAYIDVSQCEMLATEKEWVARFVSLLLESIGPIDSNRSDEIISVQQLKQFFSYLVELSGTSVIILIDEISTIPRDIQRHFFSVLRAMFNERSDLLGDKNLRLITFVFGGTFDPETLIEGDNSPFNIARDILTSDHDFSLHDIEKLGATLLQPINASEIIAVSGGHPYITVRLLDFAEQGYQTHEAVRQLLQNDVHFRNLGSTIRSFGKSGTSVLEAVLSGEEISCATGMDPSIDALVAIGVLKCGENGSLQVRCEIYTQFVTELVKRLMTASLGSSSAPVSDGLTTKELDGIDILIVTALQEELAAVLRIFGAYEEINIESRVFYRSRVHCDVQNTPYEVVTLCLHQMGSVQAALATQKSIGIWSPLRVFLIGIAAGNPEANELEFGDVIVGQQIVSYEQGAETIDGHQPRFLVFQPDSDVAKAVLNLPDIWPRHMSQTEPEPRLRRQGPPKKHFGVVATGEKIVRAPGFVKDLSKSWPKLIGIEMEGYGVSAAVHEAGFSSGTLLIKGISDWADEHKNDKWRYYACDAAASFAFELVKSGPFLSRRAS